MKYQCAACLKTFVELVGYAKHRSGRACPTPDLIEARGWTTHTGVYHHRCNGRRVRMIIKVKP